MVPHETSRYEMASSGCIWRAQQHFSMCKGSDMDDKADSGHIELEG